MVELAEEKTRLIEFGRFAERDRKKRGDSKPETFDFLGFTFYCSTNSKRTFYRVKVKTSSSKYRAKVKAMDDWIRSNRHMELSWLFSNTNLKLQGHYNYYGVTDNTVSMERFRYIEYVKQTYELSAIDYQLIPDVGYSIWFQLSQKQENRLSSLEKNKIDGYEGSYSYNDGIFEIAGNSIYIDNMLHLIFG